MEMKGALRLFRRTAGENNNEPILTMGCALPVCLMNLAFAETIDRGWVRERSTMTKGHVQRAVHDALANLAFRKNSRTGS
jgi:hypothetical protein